MPQSHKVRNGLILITVIALLVGAGYLLKGPIFGSVVPVSGVSVVGLQNVGVYSNVNGQAGTWWLATALLGGGQTLNAQGQGGQTVSASTLNTNSSYVCGTTCQQDNLQISALYSYVLYGAQAAGTGVYSYNISYQGFGNNEVYYQTCYGGPIYGTSGMVNTYNRTNQLVNFAGCANGAARALAYQNYNQSCRGISGVPLVINTTPGYTFYAWIGSINVLSGQNEGCFQLNSVPYATIYGLNSAAAKYGIRVTMNGQSSMITDTQQQNTSNPNLILYNIGSGFSPQTAPSETTVSLVQYSRNQSIFIEGNSGTGILSEISGVINPFQSAFGNYKTLASAQNATVLVNKQQASYLVNSYVNTQFASSCLVTSTNPCAPTGSSGTLQGLRLNDSQMLYTRPEITMLIKASVVGLYIGIAQVNMTSVQLSAFRSGSTGTAYVQIKNIGSAQGGYTVTPTSSSTQITPSYQSGTLSPGQQQTLTFTLNNNAQVSSNTTQSVQFQACSNGSNCQTITASYTLVPACNTNQQYNAGNCVALTTITTPTTTVPVTGQGQQSVNQTIPCNPQTGANCPPSSGSAPFNWASLYGYITAIIAGIGAGLAAYILLGKVKKSTRKIAAVVIAIFAAWVLIAYIVVVVLWAIILIIVAAMAAVIKFRTQIFKFFK